LAPSWGDKGAKGMFAALIIQLMFGDSLLDAIWVVGV
jgi:hypothetical protein